jgi:hypothetical protein
VEAERVAQATTAKEEHGSGILVVILRVSVSTATEEPPEMVGPDRTVGAAGAPVIQIQPLEVPGFRDRDITPTKAAQVPNSTAAVAVAPVQQDILTEAALGRRDGGVNTLPVEAVDSAAALVVLGVAAPAALDQTLGLVAPIGVVRVAEAETSASVLVGTGTVV